MASFNNELITLAYTQASFKIIKKKNDYEMEMKN